MKRKSYPEHSSIKRTGKINLSTLFTGQNMSNCRIQPYTYPIISYSLQAQKLLLSTNCNVGWSMHKRSINKCINYFGLDEFKEVHVGFQKIFP